MSSFNNKLRKALEEHVKNSKESYHKVAIECDIVPQIIYNFRSGTGGLDGENTVKLMNHLGMTLEDLK